MSTWYHKIATLQDVTRTFVVNAEAASEVFGFTSHQRDHQRTITLVYPNGETRTERIYRKQDYRISLDKNLLTFVAGDLVSFEKIDVSTYRCMRLAPKTAFEISKKLNRKNYFISSRSPN